jgi:hypothetical protein
MKALCCLMGFSWRVSFGPDLLVVSTQFLSPYPVVFVVMGLLGLISNHLVSLHIVSPGYGLVYDYWFLHSWLWWLLCQDACFRVDCYFMALFYISIIRVDWENHEGYALRVLGVIIRSLCSSVHSLSYLVNCHPVLQSYW